VGDNIVGLLTRLSEQRQAVHRVLQRIAGLTPTEREEALERLLILAGLRKALGNVLEEEARKMPLLNDIMDHEVFGPKLKAAMQMGELTILRRQIQTKFGPIPPRVEERLSQLSAKELEELSVRVITANDLNDLLQ
jgi:hypothetical protein